MTITVYSKPSCVQCDATTRALDKAGIVYATVDMSADPDALERVKALGHLQAPVVEIKTGGDPITWAGFRPDLIKQHITQAVAA